MPSAVGGKAEADAPVCRHAGERLGVIAEKLCQRADAVPQVVPHGCYPPRVIMY
jgi:hypothetical protein